MKTDNTKRRYSLWLTLTTGIVAGILLVIANSGFWANKYLFNEQNFSAVAVQALTSDDSRAAIASSITETMYQNRPIARALLANPTNDLLDNMIQSDRTQGVLNRAVTRLHIAVTSKEKKQISLDMTGIKSTLSSLANITNGQSNDRINPDNIPDKFVLFDAANLPDFSKYAAFLLIISPVSLLLALILLAVPYIKDKQHWHRTARWQGLIIITAGALALSTGPVFKPQVLRSVNEETQRVIVTNLYDAFIATFNAQTTILIVIGAIVILVPWLYSLLVKIAALITANTKST